jgi:hypothetical protein
MIATAVRAIAKAQKALCAEAKLAAEVGWRKFPPEPAALITRIVERDAPCYDPYVYEDAVPGMNRFARTSRRGPLSRTVEVKLPL